MTFEAALRWTEILSGLAFVQQSLEHAVADGRERTLFLIRLLGSAALLFNVQPANAEILLFVNAVFILRRFNGPYNGGSDRMSLLVLTSLLLARWAPSQPLRELALGYLAMQVTLSYFIAGWVKLVNPDWRSGLALADVFRFSVYPVTEAMTVWATRQRVLAVASWYVISLELLFPLSLWSPLSLSIALVLAAGFHLSNALLFGLNRFLWIWMATYPTLFWLQQRVITGA